MTRCALYAVWALTATALTGCSEELSQMFSETTRVEVEARFVPMDDMKTRAADGLDVSGTGFSCVYAAEAGAAASPNSKAKIMIDDGASSYTAYTYRVTGSSALTVEGVAPTFPSAVNEVHVYGWYPYTASSSFTIQINQSTTRDYCLSDLMLANRASCTRDGNSVTPAALAFRHVMSKVKLVLTLGADVTITDVALKNVKPTVTIDESNPASLTVGSASGSAGDVALLSSGSITSASALAARTLAAVIPAQSISGSFITITAEIGGTPSTITYSFDAGSKTFASGKEYTANIAVDGTLTGSPTVSLDAWAGSEGTVFIETGAGGPVTLSSYTLDLFYPGSAGTITASAGGSSYSATSADPSVATVSVSGSTITVTPVGVGSTQVIVVGTQGGVINSSICTVTVVATPDPGVSLASATVGMIVASNGKAYTTSNWSASYGTKVAVVGYKNGSRGYAVALVNSTSQTWNEITNSGANKNVDCTLADGKRGSVPVAPAGTTWKVLNMANYKLVWQAMGSADTYNATSNGLITAAGGTALSGSYWSTQEYNARDGYSFNSSGWGMGPTKDTSCNVRPVLAW